MSQVRKLKEGGTPITIDGIRYNKEEFDLAARDNIDKYAKILKLDSTLKELFKQDVEHYIATGEANSANVKLYAKELSLYGVGVSLYLPKIRQKYNGNDYILKNYILEDYNGDINLFESDWADNKDEEARRKAFINYLEKAASDTEHYDDYAFLNSKYKTVEEFNNALRELAEAIKDDDISNEDRTLAYSLGIDIDRWVQASAAKASTTTTEEKTPRLLKEEEIRAWAKQLGLSGEALESAVADGLRAFDASLQAAVDETVKSWNDTAFLADYNGFIERNSTKFNEFNSLPQLTPNENAIRAYDQSIAHKNLADRAGTLKWRLALIQNANGYYGQEHYDYAEWICRATGQTVIIIGLPNPYALWIYDQNSHKFLVVGVMDPGLDNVQGIDTYRQTAKNNFKSHKEGGKILKAQLGLAITQEYNDYLDGLLKSPETVDQSILTPEDNEDWLFEGADYAHMIAAGGDLAALAASFVPGGAVASLAAGIGSAILDTGADFSQVVKGEMSIGSALFNTAVNVGSALLGMVPGGKAASIMLKAAKYVPRIIATLGAMNVAPSIINSFDKLQKNQQLSKEDWLGIVQGIRLLALGVRDLRGIHLNKKYSVGNEGMEIGVSNGKSVKLNRNEAVEYLSLKTDELKTNWLRSKGKIEEGETVTKSLFGLKSNEKMLGEREFITPREAVKLGYQPSSSSYRYAYTINNRFQLPAKVPVLLNTATGAPSVAAAAAPSVAASAAPQITILAHRPAVVANPRTIELTGPPGTVRNVFEPNPRVVVNAGARRSGYGYHKEGGKVLKFKDSGLFPLIPWSLNLYTKLDYKPTYYNNPVERWKADHKFELNFDSESKAFNKVKKDLELLKKEKPWEYDALLKESKKWAENKINLLKGAGKKNEDVVDVSYLDYLKQTPDTLSNDLENAINIGKDTALGTVILGIKDTSKMGNNLTAPYQSASREESVSSDPYGITRKFLEVEDALRNANIKPLTSNAETAYALNLETSKNLTDINILKNNAISNAELVNLTNAVNTANKNRLAEVANANANQDKATALYNQGIMKGMLEHQAIIQAKLNRLYEQIGDLENKKMTRDAKLGEAWNARQRYMDSAWTLADLLKLELDRISKINEIYENNKSDPAYTLEKAVKDWESLYGTQYNLNKQNLQRPLEYYHALLNLGIGEWNIPDVGAKVFLPNNGLYQNLYSRTMSTDPNNPNFVGIYLPSWVKNGIVTPIRKSGGSLSYAERKALLDDKLAHDSEKLRKKLMYDDYKTTKVINAKARKDALKIFADVNNATIKEIFKLINKAVGI